MIALTLAIALSINVLPSAAHSGSNLIAALPSTTAIKDARILLRNALPINNPLIREVQATLEKMPKQANLKRWSNLSSDIEQVNQILAQKSTQILQSVSPNSTAVAQSTLVELQQALVPLQAAIADRNRDLIKPLSEDALVFVGKLENMMVAGFPFEVPTRYASLPQLKGRATVEIKTNKGTFTVILDGYSAPVNAGQFADLVQRGFYNGLEFNRADDNYFLQAGDPAGEADGFVDPKTGKIRAVPMEILIKGEKKPIYGLTLGDAGKPRATPALPFSAYGTMAMAHGDDPNGGSSQFFIYLFESDLTPAGLNLIDGNYSAFGYLEQGEEVLRKIKLGDKIESARIVSGAENLVH